MATTLKDEVFDRTPHSLHLRVSPTLSKTTAEGFASSNSQAVHHCPDCDQPLKKRYTGSQHGRLSGVRWECNNDSCPVIFIENPDAQKPRIVRDAIMSQPEKIRVPDWLMKEIEERIAKHNPNLIIEQLFLASVVKGIPILERLKPEEIIEVLSKLRRK